MSKAYSVAAKRRAKQSLPKLAPIEKKVQHRIKGKFAKEDDPQKTAREGRERQLGGKGRRLLSGDPMNPILGHEIGYVLQACCKPEVAVRLWDTWQAYCAAEEAYRKRILGMSAHPKGASIQAMPEPLQTDQSMRVDMRTDEERDRQAVSVWMKWQGYLGCIPTDWASAMRQAERGNGRKLWRDGEVTAAGLTALDAIKALREASDV